MPKERKGAPWSHAGGARLFSCRRVCARLPEAVLLIGRVLLFHVAAALGECMVRPAELDALSCWLAGWLVGSSG